MNSRRPALLVSVATALAVVGALLTPISAQAATYGSVSGVVTLATGAPAKGATVQVLELSSWDGLPLPAESSLRVTTNATGAFALPSVRTGEYTIQVSGVSGYFPQYLGGSVTIAGSKPFIVATAKESYQRIALEASASLAVSVKSLAGKAVKGASVAAYSRNDLGEWTQRATGTTSASGTFTFTSLNADVYRLRTWSTTGAIPSVYSGDSTSLNFASSVLVSGGVTASYAFSVPTTGAIKGTIAGTHDGVTVPKLAGVTARLFRIEGAFGDPGTYVEATDYSTVSSSAGAYSFAAVTPGTYTLRFTPPRVKNGALLDPAYGETFLGGTNSPDIATRITVVAGGTASVGATTLAEGATLTGRVLWTPSDPIDNIPVYVYNASVPPPLSLLPGMESARTDANGVFTVNGLGAGSWRLTIGSGSERVLVTDGYSDYYKPVLTQHTLFAGTTLTVPDTTLEYLDFSGQPTIDTPTTITGMAQVGHELTAHSAVFSPNLVEGGGAFLWLRDGVAIPGAIGTNYTLTGMDAGRKISVRQTVLLANRYARDVTSSPTDTVWEGSAPSHLTSMSITGSLKVDAKVVANPGTWNLPGLSYTYNWCDNTGSPVLCTVLGSGKEFTPSGALLGRPIALEITTHRYGYGSTRAMLGVGTVGTGTFGPVTPAKVTRSGSVLTLAPGTWSSAVTSTNPTWQYFNVATATWVTAGTGMSLDASALVGKRIRVVATINGVGVAPLTFSLHAQTGVATPPTGDLTLQPNYTVPDSAFAPVVINPNDPDDIGTDGTYQWQYKKGTKWVPIPGAFNFELPIGDSLAGKYIRLYATVDSVGYTQTSFTTPPAYVLPRGEPELTNPISVSGSPTVGVTVTNTTPPVWNVAGVKTSYSWQYDSSGWKNIPGATKSTYTVGEAYFGKSVRAVITGTKAGYQTSVRYSASGTVAKGTLTQSAAGVVKKSGSKWVVTAPTMKQGATTKIYQWSYYDEVANDTYFLSGGPTLTSIPVADTGGHTPHVEIQHKRTGYNDLYTSTWGPYIVSLAVSTAGSIQLPDGDVRVGHTLNATPGIFTPTVTSRTYQWYAGSGSKYTAIAGATGPSFVPTAAQLDKNVRVVVTGHRDGFKPASFTATTIVSVSRGVAPAVVSNPSVTGTLKVGNLLTAHLGTWNGTGFTYSYAWYRGAGTTPIGTKSTYTLSGADVGTTVKLTVVANRPGYAPSPASFTTSTIVQGDLSVRKEPVVTASGSKLKVSAGTWSTNVSTSVVWHVHDRATDASTNFPGAVGQWFSTTPYPGQKITVTVQASAVGYSPDSTTFVAKNGRGATWIGSDMPVTTATNFGGPSMSLNSNWDLVAGSTRFIWKRDGKEIAGADTSWYFYSFTDADVGKVISVTVRKITGGYNVGEKTFTMTGKVIKAIGAPSVRPSVPLTATVGTPLTVANGTWPVSSLTFAHQWYYVENGAEIPIPGAKTATFTPNPELAGRMVFARVTATKANHVQRTSDTDTVQVDPGAAATASSAASTTIVLTTPDTLTANLGTVTPGFTVTVQWFHNGVAVWGETGRTYTYTADGPGTAYAVFTARRPGYLTTTFTTPEYTIP